MNKRIVKEETYNTEQLIEMGLLPFITKAQHEAFMELGFPYSTVTEVNHETGTVTFGSDCGALGPYYQEVPCEVKDGQLIIPSFEIPSSFPSDE